MKTRVVVVRLLLAISPLLGCVGVAQAQIQVTKARIGCLDIQKDPNLTALVGSACNGKYSCSYKAPTPQQYTSAGVHAATRTFCAQAMEIEYQCGNGAQQTVTVPGDAWMHPPADLECQPPAQVPSGKPLYIPPKILPGQLQPVTAAGTPILETVYIPPNVGLPGRVTSISYSGSVQIQPADSIVLRLRAPYPTDMQILVNGKTLPLVAQGAPLPNPDTSGYFRVTTTPMPGWPDKVLPQTPGYDWFFWAVEVKLPQQFRFHAGQTDVPAFTLTVRDSAKGGVISSANPAQGPAPDLVLQMSGYSLSHCRRLADGVNARTPSLCPPDPSAPSVVFQSGENSKDNPDWFNIAGIHGPHMPRAKLGIVASDVTVAGWLTVVPTRGNPVSGQCLTGKSEDWHFDFQLDPDFIQRNYPSGDLLPFAGAIMPGQPEDEACWGVNPSYGCPCALPGCAAKISFTGGRAPNVSDFLLPGGGLGAELNAWHIDAPPGGRGPKPARYVDDNDPGEDADPNFDYGCGVGCCHALNAWAFKPRARTILPGLEAPGRLQTGDYVIVTGTLYQDIDHLGKNKTPPTNPADLPGWHVRKCVSDVFAGQGGWLEIHPPDVIRYVMPAPPLRKYVSRLTPCVSQSADVFQTVPNKPNFWTWNEITIPGPLPDPGPNYILHHEEISDPRFRPSGTQVKLQVPYDPCRTSLVVSDGLMSPTGGTVSDSVTVLTWWEMSSTPRPKCPTPMSATATPVATAQTTQQSQLAMRVLVTDSETKQPIAQANVSVEQTQRMPVSGVTGTDGTVVLDYSACFANFNVTNIVPCDAAANKEGHFSASFKTPALSAAATKTVSNMAYKLTVTVTDLATKAPVQGATVKIADYFKRALASGTTAADGTASFPSPSSCNGLEPCVITVSKNGYADYSFKWAN